MGERTAREEIALGHIKAYKLGARLYVDIEQGLDYMRSLPAAVIKPPGPRKGSRKTAASEGPLPTGHPRKAGHHDATAQVTVEAFTAPRRTARFNADDADPHTDRPAGTPSTSGVTNA